MAEARAEYRAALQKIAFTELLPLAKAYAETERPIKFCRQLGKWLRDEEWHEQLTLRPVTPSSVKAVTEAPRHPAIDWPGHHARFMTTGKWPSYLGPPPGQPGCKMPVIDQSRGAA